MNKVDEQNAEENKTDVVFKECHSYSFFCALTLANICARAPL
jgi:hypothetical protein